MLSFFSNLFTGRQSLRRHVPHISAIATHSSIGQEALAPHAQWYETAPYVYVAVNRIAEAGALVPLRLFRKTAQGRIAIEQHPFLDLLDNPNPSTSRFELLEQTLGMLELTGNAYWFVAGDDDGLPREIWALRPDRMTIVPDNQRYVRGYVYELDGKHIPLETVEVIHFKRWHPNNDYYGFSAVSAARSAVIGDKAMAQWNANTFGRDFGIPAGIVNIKSNATDKDFERIKQEWRTTYGGAQRRTAFLRAQEMEWVHIGLNHTDMDFLQGRKANRDEILNIFGIPIGLLSENATEANAKVAERTFIERTLYPKLVRLAQRLTQEFLPFYGDDYVLEFADIRPTDAHLRLEEIRTAQSVLSINEIRAQYYDLPPTIWGDLPLGMAPQQAQNTPITPKLSAIPPIVGTAPVLSATTPIEKITNESEPTMKPSIKNQEVLVHNPQDYDTEIDTVLDEYEPTLRDDN
jgi:HK97 family phage portal protein